MKKFLLTSAKRTTEVFNTLEEVKKRLSQISKHEFNNEVFLMHGRPYGIEEFPDGTEITEWHTWQRDSVVFERGLTKKEYVTFYIERFDMDGNKPIDFED